MMPPPARPVALVLGAGIQGVSVALALVHAGWGVELIDRAPAPLLRTSLHGEGKLHLGYVYGNDPGWATAALMVDGALSFAELLDRWLPRPIEWGALRSEPFVYAILADSMVSPEQLGEHYSRVDEAVADRFGSGATYAGARTFSPSERLRSPHCRGLSGDVVAAFQTGEIAVDPGLLREELLAGLGARDVTRRSECTVRAVERTPSGFVVTATDADGDVVTRHADAVVNCLWDGRLAVDVTMGISPPRPWSYRLKYAVNGMMSPHHERPTTTTFALGPFGDVVCRPDGRVYVSWYPVCRGDWSSELEPPASWRPAIDGEDTTASEWDVASATVAALGRRLAPLQHLRIDSVTAGVVVAWGDSDIDQPDSELHQRHAIGVHDHDGYLSVDTGKLTTAPLFAERVVDVLGIAGRRCS